jgi:hypothetical protein
VCFAVFVGLCLDELLFFVGEIINLDWELSDAFLVLIKVDILVLELTAYDLLGGRLAHRRIHLSLIKEVDVHVQDVVHFKSSLINFIII